MQRTVAPSMLSAEFGHLDRDTRTIDRSAAEWVHIDVMDGVFVPNISFGFPVMKPIRKATSKFLDVHLMIVRPEEKIEEFAKAGADILTVHAEACGENTARALRAIRGCGMRAGIAVSPDTDEKTIFDSISEADMVLSMSVYPGLGGQKMIERTLEKAKSVARFLEKQGMVRDIEMDGGINEENIAKVKASGVNVIVAGNTVFRSSDMAKTIRLLRDGDEK